jgi:hypothetical protein
MIHSVSWEYSNPSVAQDVLNILMNPKSYNLVRCVTELKTRVFAHTDLVCNLTPYFFSVGLHSTVALSSLLLSPSWSLSFRFPVNVYISYSFVRVTCSANLIPFDLITEILRQITELILKVLVVQSYSFQYLCSTYVPQYRILRTPPFFCTREKVSDSCRVTAEIIVFYCNIYILGDKNINLNRITASSLCFNRFWMSRACNFTVALI